MRAILGMMLGVVVVAALMGRPAGAQVQEDVLGTLLGEVRALRVAIEQMATAGARVQLALGRLQLQEQRVNAMLRRSDDLQRSLLAGERLVDERRKELAYAEMQIQGAKTSAAREHFEGQRPGLQAALTQALAELQQLQTEAADLKLDIAADQQRWTDINRQLDELDRILRR